ncbi:hypothetical protein OQA88_3603 [Cercophora sp. LCS_1]
MFRPSFSIRRLISQRKHDGVEGDDGLYITNEKADGGRSSKEFKNKTWPKGTRKGPIPTIDIRRSEDIHRIVVLPPLPDTPKSWAGSLGSYENDSSFISPRTSPVPPTGFRTPTRTPQRSPLLAPQQLESPQRARSKSSPSTAAPFLLLSPPSSPWFQQGAPPRDDFSPDSPTTPWSPAEPLFPRIQTVNRPPSMKWTFDNWEPNKAELGNSTVYFEDIERLINETEEAFRLRHSRSTKRPSIRVSVADTIRSPVSVERTSLARRTSQRSSHSSTGSAKSQTKDPLMVPRLATPNRVSSLSKTKNGRLKKTNGRPRAPPAAPVSTWTASPTSKWSSAKGLFAIRLFNRLEVDEMLPESVLHEIRMSRATQARLAREAAEAETESDSDTSPTDSETFDFEDFPQPPSRNVSMPWTKQDSDTPRSSTSSHVEPDAQKQQPPTHAIPPPPLDPPPPPPPVSDQLKPAPLPIPSRSPHRRTNRPPLPTIPETAILSPTSRLHPTATSDYIFLPSTNYTLTHPHFRQGPIRLSRADLPITKLATAIDDTLDWTAFQMAILGGAGDFFGESTDYSKPSDGEILEGDEIARWFGEFDVPVGDMVGVEEARERGEMREMREVKMPVVVVTRPTGLGLGLGLGLGVELEGSGVRVPPRGSSLLGGLVLPGGIGAGQEGVGCGLGWMLDGKTTEEKRGSLESLPQSPMLDLVVSHGVDGANVVPMGFNLGHDLGDFLRWEAEVFGGEYKEMEE